jgi:glycosyltransferase involved in cell wall biosynthesis
MLTQYGVLAASSRTRAFQYLPLLQQRGCHCRVLTVLPDRAIGGSQVMVTRHGGRKLGYYLWAVWRTLSCGLRLWWLAPRFDLLFIQKVILPAPIRLLLRRRAKPVLYDFDDAIFTTEVQQRHWLAGWKQWRNSRGLPAMLRLAAAAVVENDYTGSYAARWTAVVLITGPIDTDRYRPAEPRPGRDEIVLGWIGSATTVPYLQLIAAPLRRLCARYPHTRVEIVGAAAAPLPGVPVVTRPWGLASEVEALQGFDIGLMPLPDDPWTRGKGGYKLLQYMAVGLPVVASPVGVNTQIVAAGDSGYLAGTEAEWEEHLERLLLDPARRGRMGRRGRQIVEDRYSLRRSADVLAAAFQRAAAGPG